MRSFARHVREWRTPLAVGALILAGLAILKGLDPTAARVIAAIVMLTAIGALLFPRQR
jgi:uncharacterized membrane protein YphA (DoxX/SURF4 family)